QPWLVAGDFNEVMMPNEFESAHLRAQSQMQSFRQALNDCSLHDLGYCGFPFTWCNNRKSPDTVRARLDRAVATKEWSHLYPRAIVKHLPHGSSDHLPLLVVVDPIIPVSPRPTKRRFRFEAFWTTIPGCENVVKQSWSSSYIPDSLTRRIWTTRVSLLKWYQAKVGPIKARLIRISQELDELSRLPITDAVQSSEIRLKAEQESLWKQEELYWKQRGKAHWLRCGDRNTAFFHASASEKRSQNRITGIRNEQGHWETTHTAVRSTFLAYYQRLFASSVPDLTLMDRLLSIIPCTVTESMRTILERPYTAAEVWPAIRSMKPLSSPGPDGLPPLFYQKYWHTVGPATTNAVLKLLNNGNMEPRMNHSYIALIPKIPDPQEPAHFRPISLSNVVYKI
ncbi:hypothetical protein M569_04615, partial [Genlisea aurea]